MEKLPSVVADIMSHPVITVDVGVNIRDVALLMTDKGVGCLIIVERGRPLGIVTKSDIIRRVVSSCKDPCIVKVEDVMSKPLITIGRDINILEAMRKMREHSITQIVVMEDGNLAGIVAKRDVIRGVSIASVESFSSLRPRHELVEEQSASHSYTGMEASVEMSSDSSYADIIKEKRNVLLAVLMLPVVGMVISMLLIFWRFPHMIGTAIPIIFIIMIQYVLLVGWINKKIDVI